MVVSHGLEEEAHGPERKAENIRRGETGEGRREGRGGDGSEGDDREHHEGDPNGLDEEDVGEARRFVANLVEAGVVALIQDTCEEIGSHYPGLWSVFFSTPGN